MNLPISDDIKVRIVKVVLDTGETELLITSLLDQAEDTTGDIKGLYHLRWGVAAVEQKNTSRNSSPR
ncbi:MAG: hypothetical protein AAGF85_09900 [Bacteroidota bacterium]